MRFVAIAVVVETEADDQTLADAVRRALAGVGATPQLVPWSPDGDTIAEAMGMPGETIDVLDVGPAVLAADDPCICDVTIVGPDGDHLDGCPSA